MALPASPATFSTGFNPINDLKALGFTPTSGYRTPGHQAALKSQGLTKTSFGSHQRGDGIDIVPPPGMGKAEAISLLQGKYPGARFIPSNGRAVHATFSGWGGAPDISGSRRRYGG